MCCLHSIILVRKEQGAKSGGSLPEPLCSVKKTLSRQGCPESGTQEGKACQQGKRPGTGPTWNFPSLILTRES